MDEDFREAERLYNAGHISVEDFAAVAIRSGKFLEIEAQAYSGNQNLVMPYLHMLHFRGDIDVQNLWVCPYKISLRRDVLAEFGSCFPIKSSDTVQSIVDKVSVDKFPYAFIVDVADLELADGVEGNLRNRFGTLTADEESSLEASLRFNMLCLTALARVVTSVSSEAEEQPGIHFVFEECHHTGTRYRSTHKYYKPEFGTPDLPVHQAYKFPLRRTKRKLIPVYEPRGAPFGNRLYVVVIHMPTGRAYGLTSSYGLLNRDITDDEKSFAMLYSLSHARSRAGNSQPDWATMLPASEFISYWVQD